MDLEKADLSRLYETGWKMPETFIVKAADGVTDLYGNMWKPFDFDPKKKYPIIAHVYPGPQTEGVTYTFSADQSAISSWPNSASSSSRSAIAAARRCARRRISSFGYFNLRDYGLADKKSAIEQLAARHPWIDIDRVGIYGHSGGGFMSAAAVLQKPYNEFFKVAVASSRQPRQQHLQQRLVRALPRPARSAGRRAAEDEGGRQRQRHERGSSHESRRRRRREERRQEGREQGRRKKADEKGRRQEGCRRRRIDAKKDEKKDDKKDGEKKDGDKKDEDKDEEKKPQTNSKFTSRPTPSWPANLKGHLLLVHGDMDNNVHPANTMRLVDALIKANKRFDMLILPGKRHGYADYQPYFTQRMWDFFAEHLLNEHQTSADIMEKVGAGGRK